MEIINYFINIIKEIIKCINTIEFFIILFGFLILYNIFIYLFKNKKNLRIAKNFKDPEEIKLENLKNLPLVNIIIPAWKEGESFKNNLLSITKLKYPNIRTIVNAGGDDKTIDIANEYKNNKNFIILKQEKGPYLIQGQNKIRALNNCFEYVSEGILYLIDADCYLTDDILLRMIYPIINNNEKIINGNSRPILYQEKSDLVKYIQLSRFDFIDYKIVRYTTEGISGSNACLSYDVLKAIGKFSENKLVIEELSRGKDIADHGFRGYNLIDYRSYIFTEFPSTLKELYHARSRYIKYKFLYSLQTKKKNYIISILMLFLISIYITLLPILFFIQFGFFLIGILIFLNLYFKKIRKYYGFKSVIDKQFYETFHFSFFLKMFIYIYIEILFNIRIMFELFLFIIKCRKEKATKIS